MLSAGTADSQCQQSCPLLAIAQLPDMCDCWLAHSLLKVPELEGAGASKSLSEQDASEAHHGKTAIPVSQPWG